MEKIISKSIFVKSDGLLILDTSSPMFNLMTLDDELMAKFESYMRSQGEEYLCALIADSSLFEEKEKCKDLRVTLNLSRFFDRGFVIRKDGQILVVLKYLGWLRFLPLALTRWILTTPVNFKGNLLEKASKMAIAEWFDSKGYTDFWQYGESYFSCKPIIFGTTFLRDFKTRLPITLVTDSDSVTHDVNRITYKGFFNILKIHGN